MMQGTTVPVFIEIEQNGSEKWEWNREKQVLELDRTLPKPFVYPFAYGFIPNTLAGDGDELDALIITLDNHPLVQEVTYYVHIVGVLVMDDEKGRDEKILCVLEKDWVQGVQDLHDLPEHVHDSLVTFFKRYKSNTPGRWSRVLGLRDRQAALEIYQVSTIS
jgi:inorganic pyrophosphatase